MNFFKKTSIYLLIGLLCFSSVLLSYEKAESCEAVSIGLYLGGATILLAVSLYGAYYVSDPENREDIKESLTNYAEMTEENAKLAYETNKKLFSDFVTYATAKGGGSSAVYTAAGESYTVEEMAEHGFPDFEDWDEQMKKQGSPSSGGLGSIWDALSFGVELLDLVRGFFDDDGGIGGTGGGGSAPNGLYYNGESGYINRETGEVNIQAYSVGHELGGFDDDYHIDSVSLAFMYNYWLDTVVDSSVKNTIRYCLVLHYYSTASASKMARRHYFVSVDGDWDYGDTYEYRGQYSLAYGYDASSIYKTDSKATSGYWTKQTATLDSNLNVVYSETLNSYNMENYDNNITSAPSFKGLYNYAAENDFSTFTGVHANVPIFADAETAKNYIATGDDSGALNTPQAYVTPTDSPEPDTPPSAVSIYCNHFNGRSVAPGDVVNVNYTIGNDWDGTPTNLTVILQNDDGITVTPGLTDKPVPTLVDDDGSNTTNNYIINITNILQPIQTTVTNIYNFFQIDVEQITDEISVDSPSTKFEPIVSSVQKMKDAFGSDSFDENGKLNTYYPVISMKCPAILEDYVDTYDDAGNKIILFVDFADWAIYFVRFRGFLAATMWVGMIFFLLREFKALWVIG